MFNLTELSVAGRTHCSSPDLVYFMRRQSGYLNGILELDEASSIYQERLAISYSRVSLVYLVV